MRYRTTKADKDAFEALVEGINDRIQPNSGWGEVHQLPRLSAEDKAVILKANPDALDDIMCEAGALADAIVTGDTAEVLQLQILLPLESALRNRLLWALQKHEEQVELEIGDMAAVLADSEWGARS